MSINSLQVMKFPLSCALALAAARLASCDGPYDVRYYATTKCGSRSQGLGCNLIPAYECCEAPPSRDTFKTLQAFSVGPAGILIFSDVTADGGCGNCHDTGSINTCYAKTK